MCIDFFIYFVLFHFFEKACGNVGGDYCDDALDGNYKAVVALYALDVALSTLKYSACYAHSVASCPLLACLAKILHAKIVDRCYADKHLHLIVGYCCWLALATIAVYHHLAHELLL